MSEKRGFRFTILIAFLFALLGFYGFAIYSAYSNTAGRESLFIARNLNYFYLTIFALLVGGYAIFLYKKGCPWRITALLLYAIWAFHKMYVLSGLELADARTYGYEIFITLFYFWLAAVSVAFLAALLFHETAGKITKYSIIFTAIMAVVFAVEGRASIEHILPIMGGLLSEISLRAAEFSKLDDLWLVMAVIAAVYYILYVLIWWIEEGKLRGREIYRTTKLLAVYIAASLIAALSIPPATILNNNDIVEAKVYIQDLILRVKQHYSQNSAYPTSKEMVEMLDEQEDRPFLIRRYEYLDVTEEGGFYLSRKGKFCMLFQNPGYDFGYFSITSDRDWKFITPGQSEKHFIQACDEGGPVSHEGMLAGYLGLKGEDDPYGRLSLEADAVLRRAESSTITGALTEEFDKMLEESPQYSLDFYNQKPEVKIEKKPFEQPESAEEWLQKIRGNTGNVGEDGKSRWENK